MKRDTKAYDGSTQDWLPVRDIKNRIVILKDGRYIKICEVLPVNFYLKSEVEQENIIFYFASYLKIAPDRMQIRVVTQRADIDEYIKNLMQRLESEQNELCRKMTEDEAAFVKGLSDNTAVKKRFFITFEYVQNALSHKSLFVAKGKFKKMPTLTDLYNELISQPETKGLALMLEKFAVGSLSGFGGETNVDLDNKYMVLDISEMTEHLKPLGMFMALDYVWDKAKESRIRKKVIFLDELWTLIGAGSNRMAADYVLEIFKVIRSYGGAAIAATQDIGDFFSLDDGKYGKGVINNSRIKFILQLEEDEAFAVQKYMSLSDEETIQIKKLVYGKVLRKMH